MPVDLKIALRDQARTNITDVILSLAGRSQLDTLSGPVLDRHISCAHRTMRPFRHRKDLGAELRRLDISGVGVEIGVQRGRYTRVLLEGWRQAEVFVQVDLWEPQANYVDIANHNASAHLRHMVQAYKVGIEMTRRGYAKAVLQCRNYSTACAQRLPDASVDFVYVDARHDRTGVLEDLRTYWPKIRVGGVFAGHDYTEQSEPDLFWDHYGLHKEREAFSPSSWGQDWTINSDGTRDLSGRVVRGAVDDFFSGTAEESPEELRRCPRQVTVSYRESSCNTWAVRK